MPSTFGGFEPVAKPLHRQRSTNATSNVIPTKNSRKQSLVSMVSKVGTLFQKKNVSSERVPEKLPMARKPTAEDNPFNFRLRRELASMDLHQDIIKADELNSSYREEQESTELQRGFGSTRLQDFNLDLADEESEYKLQRTHPSRELHSLVSAADEAEKERYSLLRTRPSRELHDFIGAGDFDFSSDEDSDSETEDAGLPSIVKNRVSLPKDNAAPPPLPPRSKTKDVPFVAEPLNSLSFAQEPVLRTFYITSEDETEEPATQGIAEVGTKKSYAEKVSPVRGRRRAVLLRNDSSHLTQMPYDSQSLERYKRMQITGLSKRLITKQMEKDGVDPSCLFGVNYKSRNYTNPWIKAYSEQKRKYYWKNINTREILMEQPFNENVDI